MSVHTINSFAKSAQRIACRSVDPVEQRSLSFQNLLRFLKDDVLRYSPFYRRKFAQLGIRMDAISHETEFANTIPFTDKEELRSHFADFVLQPNWPGAEANPVVEELSAGHIRLYRERALQTAETAGDIEPPVDAAERAYREFLYDWQPILTIRTGGTTGTAAQSAYTLSDVHGPLRRAGLFHHNVRTWSPTQRFMSLLPAGEHLGFYGNFLVPLLNGQPLRPMFGGRVTSTENQVLVAHRTRVQALYGTSSYLVSWLDTACTMMRAGQIDGLPSIELVSASAEALSEGYAANIRRSLAELKASNARLIQGMSSTELKSGGFRDCDENSGLHVDPQHFFIEMIDPETRLPAKPGAPAVLVWSHIDWRGTVILRYWSGDIIEGGVKFDECPKCGLVVPRLFQPFRRLVSDFIKVRGARVDLAELRATLETMLERDAYQIEIKSGDDGRHTVNAHVHGNGRDISTDALRDLVMTAVELRLDAIHFCESDEMQRRLYGGGGWKPRWLINE
jgi:phenylacetate-coenzyme A ligase PaaK-like adenylate-forming protein